MVKTQDKEPDYRPEALKKEEAAGRMDDEGASPLSAGELAELDQIQAGMGETAEEPDRSKKKDEEQAEAPSESADAGTASLYNPEPIKTNGLRVRWKSASRVKKWAIGAGGGLAMALIGALIGLFAFLIPFKATQVINMIEQQLGGVPEYAVEQRLEYYMNRYLMLRTIAKVTSDKDVERPGKYIYLDNSLFKSLYTNWKGANLEGSLLKQGWRLDTQLPPGQLLGRNHVRPTDFKLVNLNVGVNSPLRNMDLNSKEARAFVKEWTKSETRSRQVFKRYTMRKMLKRYYGIGDWKIFEDKRESTRKTFLEKKRDIKKYMVTQTVGKLSTRYSLYMNCLLDGGTACKDIKKGVAANEPDEVKKDKDGKTTGGGGHDKAKASVNDPEIKALGNEAGDLAAKKVAEAGSNVSEKAAAKSLGKQIQELGLKKILASFAVGIGLLDTISQIEKSLSSGALNIVVADKNAQQYAAFAAPILSMADQVRSGDVGMEEARILSDIIGEYQTSPVYQSFASGSGGTVSAASNVVRDCNDDGDTNDKDDVLKPGETVCPNKRIVQDKTTFTNSDGWKIFHSVAEAYRDSLGGIVSFFTDIVSKVFEITNLDKVISAVMDATGLTDVLAAGFKSALNGIAGAVVTGAETDEDAFDAIYAGMAVNAASVGGGVGANREDTIGGGYLSSEQLLAINNERQEEERYLAQYESVFDKYLSPDNTDSLLTTLAMKIPTSSSLASIFSGFNPSKLFGGLSKIFTPRALAATDGVNNPFHVINYGFPANHPIFTAHNGEGMDPEEIRIKYQCDKKVEDRWQNKPKYYDRPKGIPFDVALEADPCLLEQTVVDVGTRYFTGTYDDGVVNAPVANPQGAVGAYNIAGTDILGQDTSGIACPSSPTVTNTGLQDGYKNGIRYRINTCRVHGVQVNAIAAKQYNGMFTAMKSAGYEIKGSFGYRTNAEQEDLYNKAGSGTAAPPGKSNHQFGTAVDISCQGDGAIYYAQGKDRGRAAFSRLLDKHPCLNWIHVNSQKYGLLLQCDGKSSKGGEIRATSGGCEAWHVSPTGG